MIFFQILTTLILLLSLASESLAISTQNYEKNYREIILPFLKTGELFKVQSHDGLYPLSAIRFLNPKAKGALLIMNGQSESWLKYGEVFYDWYQKGYSIYSYDHRGQGLSPHLSPKNSQIGHISKFRDYVEDLRKVVETIIASHQPELKNFNLLAHSMGGGVATAFLETHPSPFRKVILNTPMLGLNTEPYPASLARAIVVFNSTLGMAGNRYAPGQKNNNCDFAFESNGVTHSPERWWMSLWVCKTYPNAVIGGPSNDWVNESLKASQRIRKHASRITVPVLMTQAGKEKYVLNAYQNEVCGEMQNCKLMPFPEAKHEILMEKDEIREAAFQAFDQYLQ